MPEDKLLRAYHFFAGFLTKKIWSNAHKVVANSQGLMELAQKTADKINKKVEFIPNGVDLNFFQPDKARIAGSPIKILFVGRFNKQKGLEYLIEAMKKITEIKSKDEVRLELVGEGPTKKEIIKQAKQLGVFEYIDFTPWLDKDKILKRYQNADIFVLPSLDEGMPNVLSEAMACGLPVVATDIKGNNELIEKDNGFLVPVKNSVALGENLLFLINSKTLREELGKNNIIKMKDLSWEVWAKKYLEYLR
jgi:glycosyltransferase involved in cell wall biosynthesis